MHDPQLIINHRLIRPNIGFFRDVDQKVWAARTVVTTEAMSDCLVAAVGTRTILDAEPRSYAPCPDLDYLHDQLGALVNTGVRNNGLLNIKPADFMNVRV